ncbi:MAG: hypothetical protein ACHQNT_03245 [Bacteroidia bacterium]
MQKFERFLTLFGPLLGFVLTAVGLIISASHFSQEQKTKSALEFKRDFWTKQSEIYLKTAQAIGTICAEISKSDPADFDKENFMKSKSTFASLYWGEMNFIQDSIVISDMKSFDQYIKDFNPQVTDVEYRQTLIRLGNKIIVTCRNSYIKSFDNLQIESFGEDTTTLVSTGN